MYLRSLVAWFILAPSDGSRSLEKKLPRLLLLFVWNSSIQNLWKKFFGQDNDIFGFEFYSATVETVIVLLELVPMERL